MQANYGDPSNPSLTTGFKDLSFGNWYGTDLHANAEGPGGSKLNASLGSFGTGYAAQDFKATLDKNGLDANLKHGHYNTFEAANLDVRAGVGDDVYTSAKMGQGALNRTSLDDAHVDASFDKGIHARVGQAGYDAVTLKGVELNQKLGPIVQSHVGLGEGTYNHFSGKNIYAELEPTKVFTPASKTATTAISRGKTSA